MPTIRIERFKFRFYSSDISEPPHMHVIDGRKVAKIWLTPIELEYNRGYNRPEINRIVKLTKENVESLLEAWNEHFNK